MTAIEALRHIARQACEVGPFYADGGDAPDCNHAIDLGWQSAEQRCWPCYARFRLPDKGGQKACHATMQPARDGHPR